MKAAFEDYNLHFLYKCLLIKYGLIFQNHLVLFVKSILAFNQDSTA